MQKSMPLSVDENPYTLLNTIFEATTMIQGQLLALTATNKALQLSLESRLAEMETRLRSEQVNDVKILLSVLTEGGGRESSASQSASQSASPHPNLVRRPSSLSTRSTSPDVPSRLTRRPSQIGLWQQPKILEPPPSFAPVRRTRSLIECEKPVSSESTLTEGSLKANDDPQQYRKVSLDREKTDFATSDRLQSGTTEVISFHEHRLLSNSPDQTERADVTDKLRENIDLNGKPSSLLLEDTDTPSNDSPDLEGHHDDTIGSSDPNTAWPVSHQHSADALASPAGRNDHSACVDSVTADDEASPTRDRLFPRSLANRQISFKAGTTGEGHTPPNHVVYFREDMQAKTPSCFGLRKHGTKADAVLLWILQALFGIADPDLWAGTVGSRVIHPSSPFGAGLELVSAGFVVYSIAVVPVQLSFWNGYWPCQAVPTLELDMFVDVFFLVAPLPFPNEWCDVDNDQLEILLRFFIGIEVKGRYCDRLSKIATVYLTSVDGFFFDTATSIPFSWVAWSVLESCKDGVVSTDFNQNAGIVRTIKTLRILRLTRLFRTFKLFSTYLKMMEISPTTVRIFKLFFVLSCSMHLFSCCFWRVKLETNTPEELSEWLAARSIDIEEVGTVYVVCLYFVCTVFFTVGFGDISATNFGERVFCIFLMSFAACVFGLILGELQEIYAAANTKNRELDDHMDSVISFLQENRVPKGIEAKIKNWIRFHFPQNRADMQNKEIMECLPPVLRQTLACNMNKGLFSKVVLWSHISNAGSLKDEFTAELLLRMKTDFFVANSPVATSREEADRLMIIVSGTVGIYKQGRSSDPTARLLTLGPGGSIGDNSLLGDERWAGLYGVDADFIADENCKVCVFMTSDITDVINSSPSYMMLRRLIERLKFNPEEDYLIDESPSPVVAPKAPPSLMRSASRVSFRFNSGKKAAAAAAAANSATLSLAAKMQPKDPNRKMKVEHVFHWIRIARTLLHSEMPNGDRQAALKSVVKQWRGPE